MSCRPRNPVRDAAGVELAGLDAAHWHAMHLVIACASMRPETGEDWVIEVSDELGARPLVVLPHTVRMLRKTEDAVRVRHTGARRYSAREAQQDVKLDPGFRRDDARHRAAAPLLLRGVVGA